MRAKTRWAVWRVLTSTILGAALVLQAGCAGPGAASDGKVQVGLLANLTGGAAASFGVPFQNGFELALDEARKSMDAAGVGIEVVTEDAKSTVPSAVTGYNKLRSAGVAVVVQDSQSPLGQAIAPLANDDKLALLSGAGSKLENSGGYAFRFTDLGTPTRAMGTYLTGHGAKRVGAVVASDNPSFATLADATEAGLPHGYVSRQEISATDTDFAAVLANLRNDKVDAVVLSVLPAQAGNILLQIQQSGGFKDVLLVGTVAISEETFTVARHAAVGFVFPQVWAPGADGAARFQTTYRQKYHELPTAYGALGYQVGWITAAAILHAHDGGKVSGATVRDALPAASRGDLVAKHGILNLALAPEGTASSTGVMASFDDTGAMVTVRQDG
ncbi:ABC transporter substrate-binding protein [Streptomyces sp. NPDC058424]|uniref:ABC transporter substrate-binding protein n=1 Tax=Streptomyces sp. NPDC058424 TaxID=3346491 RepID=UPI003657B134